MSKIVWDEAGTRAYETGVSNGVLYKKDSDGVYNNGVPWNGLTAITESPSGSEPTDLFADDIKYASLRSAESFGGTIEAYTYPDEFAECDGSAEPITGLRIGQQPRKVFALAYKTKIGNDEDSEAGYKLHLVYNATASPSEKSYSSVNDSPDATAFSWEFSTNPMSVSGYKPTAYLCIDSTKVNETKLAALEAQLFGVDASAQGDSPAVTAVVPHMPTPDQIITLLTPDAQG